MKKILMKISVVMLSFIMIVLLTCSVYASSDASALQFKVSSDGFATVSDCDESAQGVIVVPDKVIIGGVEYKVKYIGEKAFESCYNISEIHIPEGVTSIKNFAFRDCISLKNVYIPESLVMCQYDVFEGCGKLTIHCYEANYQFFSVHGISSNIEIVVIDAEDNPPETDEENSVQSTDFITRFINALQNLVNRIIEYFDAQDEEIELPFLPDIPFLEDLIKDL